MSVSVRIKNLSKSYKEVVALQNLNLTIDAGELFGFIGPAGAWKTTPFRMITSLLLPDAGEITIDNMDVVKEYKKIRKMTGYMPGRFSLYMDLTVEENLKFYAGIFKTSLQENYALIADVYQQIEPFKKRRSGALSGGMKQKLALSCALIHNPKLLILDEPTTGVDAVSRKEFWVILKKMQQNGITILVSTPYMSEASLCDRVALMQDGNLLSVAAPHEITAAYPHRLLQIKSDKMFRLLADLQEIEAIISAYRFGETIHLAVAHHDDGVVGNLRKILSEKGHQSLEIEEAQPNIEDCFLELMDKNSLV